MASITRLADLLDDLLAGAVAALTPDDGSGAGSGVTEPSGAPSLVYVSHGPPAAPVPSSAGCDSQLTTHTPGIRFETDRVNRCFVQPVYLLVVSLFRCVPSVGGGGAPAPDALDASAQALALDGQALVDRLVAACSAGQLFPTAGVGCDAVTWTPGLAPIRPDGGVAGWTLGLEVRP